MTQEDAGNKKKQKHIKTFRDLIAEIERENGYQRNDIQLISKRDRRLSK